MPPNEPKLLLAELPTPLLRLRLPAVPAAVRDKAASAKGTVVAAGKTAAEGTKTLVGELAHAAATATAPITAAPGAVWNKVATAIGAKKRTKKKVAKKVASKKRTTLKKKANIKKASRRSAKKKRL